MNNLKQHISEAGFRPRKRLGQNFMLDNNFLDFIRGSIEASLSPDSVIVEFGSGAGSLTSHLAMTRNKLIAVEIDTVLFNLSLVNIADSVGIVSDNVHLLNADIMSVRKDSISPDVIALIREKAENAPLIITGNLPYYIATNIIALLPGEKLNIKECFFTIQKEVAERLCATVGDKQYGAFSVVMQAMAHSSIIRTVPPDVFWPRPNVESAFVKITMRPQPLIDKKNYSEFKKFVQRLFMNRRKKLGTIARENGLSLRLASDIAERRPEALAAEEIAVIFLSARRMR